MIRWIPFLLVFAGCSGYGLSCAAEYEKKYRELLYCKQVITNLAISLEKGCLTFGECCYEVAGGCREPYKTILIQMYESLEIQREWALDAVWCEGMKKLMRQLQIKELETLQHCACLGNTAFFQQPVAVLEDVNATLEQLIMQTQKVKRERSRLAICLGLSTGCLLCILFL